jgi:hypothetical protein
MRWPWMTKKRHHETLGVLASMYQEQLDAEYTRAIREGRKQVHQWAIEANYNVFNHDNPRGAAYAAFQEAERMFAPPPLTLSEALYAQPASS